MYVHDKVHVCYWYPMENSAGYLHRVQIKHFIGEIFTYKKHPIHRNRVLQQWSTKLTWISFVTDIKQTCLGQGLGVTITARKRPSKFMLTIKDLGHTLPCHLQVTVDVITFKKPYKPQG